MKRFRELARGASSDGVLLEGEHLVEEALASQVPLEVAVLAEHLDATRLQTLAAKAQAAGARTLVVPDQVLAAMSPVRQPSGVIAIARYRPAALDAVLSTAPQLVLMLDGIQDPGNVGAIIRAAEGCGATGVVAGEGTADPFGWKALRGSMGSAFRLPVAVRQPLLLAADRARSLGLQLLAAVPRSGRSPGACDLRRPTAVLLGGEGTGLPDDLITSADALLTIPMRPPVESLNVAITAALIGYEAFRQRGA